MSAGAIAGIICAIVGVIALTIVTYILLRRVHNKDIAENTVLIWLQIQIWVLKQSEKISIEFIVLLIKTIQLTLK